MATDLEVAEYQAAYLKLANALNGVGSDTALNFCIMQEMTVLYYMLLHDTKKEALDTLKTFYIKNKKILNDEWHKKDQLILEKFNPLSS